jgi:hypothetical protein
VALTPQGAALTARRRPARAARFAEFFAMLPAQHQTALTHALPSLQLLADAGAGLLQ